MIEIASVNERRGAADVWAEQAFWSGRALGSNSREGFKNGKVLALYTHEHIQRLLCASV